MKQIIFILLSFTFLLSQNTFNRDDNYYFPDTHTLKTNDGITYAVYLDIQSGFANNFPIYIKPGNLKYKNSLGQTFNVNNYRIDYDNDETWDTNWLSGERTVYHTFPQPDDFFGLNILKIQIDYECIASGEMGILSSKQ